MEDFQSKYSGEQVEAILDSVANGEAGGGGGGITVETDPIFSSSPAASITEEKKTEWDNKMDKVTLATVATSGSYNDLSNKPTIPSAVTESIVSGWGFTKNTGTYSKPGGGIPKTDLASTVQTSLGKADTALQSYTEQYKGTVTSVKVNGVTKNQSGGVVDLGYINKQLSTTTSSSMTLSPNVYYRNTSTSLSTLTITLGGTTNNDIINEYFVEFTTSSSGTTISLPSSIKWANGVTPTFESGKTYQISIVNNLGTCVKFG